MIDIYQTFIEEKETKKDASLFAGIIKNYILNDLFPTFRREVRKENKKINHPVLKNYTITNLLSQKEKSKLQFFNDTIILNVLLNPLKKIDMFSGTYEGENKKSVICDEFEFKNFKIENLKLIIHLHISLQEFKNGKLNENHNVFNNIQREIHTLYQYTRKKYNSTEETKFPIIRKRLNLHSEKYNYYRSWNKLINFIFVLTDSNFKEDFRLLKQIVSSTNLDRFQRLDLIENTYIYKKIKNLNKINTNKFTSQLNKECINDDEITEMIKDLSTVFNHKLKKEESFIFLKNIITHYNKLRNNKLKILSGIMD